MTTAGFLIAISALAAPMFEGEFIFPPQDKHVHGSSIVELPGGDLLTVWFHGSGERTADDVQLLGARKPRGDAGWSEPFLMADSQDLPDCNPVLFLAPDKKLWLLWIAVQANEWGSSLLKYRVSEDYGAPGPPQWDWQGVLHARPKNLEAPFLAVLDNAKEALAPMLEINERLAEEVEYGYFAARDKLARRLGWMTRTPPIVLDSGRVLLGLYSDVFNCSLTMYTDDLGKTWHTSEPILHPEAKYIGNVQPALVQREDGVVVAYMRDNGIPNFVRTATSADGGETWSEPGMLDVRDSGSSVGALKLQSGRWLLVNNDLINGRHRLTARLSEDEGGTWAWSRPIEETERDQGQFSYPCLHQGNDGMIHLTYTYRRHDIAGKTIKHVVFNEDWLVEPRAE